MSFVENRRVARGLLRDRPPGGVIGRLYLVTDIGVNGTLFEDNGSAWGVLADSSDQIAVGNLASRPVASVVGQFYFANDAGRNGILYESNGSVWTQVAAGTIADIANVVLTTHAILIGETDHVNVAGPLTNGQLLIGNTGGDPISNNIAAGNNIVIGNAPGSITISTGSSNGGGVGPYSPNNFIANALIVGNGSSNLFSANLLSNGQILIGGANSTATFVPVANNIANGNNIIITNGNNSIVIGTSDPITANTVDANNLVINTISIGNSTANVFVNSTIIEIANSTSATNVIPTGIQVGANVLLSTSTLSIGNSTVNATSNSTEFQVTSTLLNSASGLTPTSLFVSGNVNLNTTTLSIGNSTVNTQINSTFIDTGTANLSTLLDIGTNVNLNTTTLSIGNSTVRATLNSTVLNVSSIVGNNILTQDSLSNDQVTRFGVEDNANVVILVTGSVISPVLQTSVGRNILVNPSGGTTLVGWTAQGTANIFQAGTFIGSPNTSEFGPPFFQALGANATAQLVQGIAGNEIQDVIAAGTSITCSGYIAIFSPSSGDVVGVDLFDVTANATLVNQQFTGLTTSNSFRYSFSTVLTSTLITHNLQFRALFSTVSGSNNVSIWTGTKVELGPIATQENQTWAESFIYHVVNPYNGFIDMTTFRTPTTNAYLNSIALAFNNVVVLNASTLALGNSTVNVFVNSTVIEIANSTSATNVIPTGILVSSNVLLNTSTLSIGNSTVNTQINSTFIDTGTANLSTLLNVGSNVLLNTGTLSIGNSTVNVFVNSTVIEIANSTSATNVIPTGIQVGANVLLNTGTLSIGNSTVNATSNSTEFQVTSTLLNSASGLTPTSLFVSSNVNLNTTTLSIGNSTVNASLNSSTLVVSNIVVEGTLSNVNLDEILDGSTYIRHPQLGSNNIWGNADLPYNGNFDIFANTKTTADGWGHSFEVSGADITYSRSTTTPFGSPYSAQLGPNAANNGGSIVSQPFHVTAGWSYSFSVWAYSTVANPGSMFFRVLWYSGDNDFSRTSSQLITLNDFVAAGGPTAANTWQQFTGTIRVPATARFCRIGLYNWIGSTVSTLTFSGCRVFIPQPTITLLSDYTPPTAFTPVLNFGGATTGITYSTQTGLYLQIGKLVFYSFHIILTNKGTATGAATVTGLPPSITSGADHIATTMPANMSTGLPAGEPMFGLILSSTGSSIVNFFAIPASSGGFTVIADTHFTNTSDVRVTGFFMAG